MERPLSLKHRKSVGLRGVITRWQIKKYGGDAANAWLECLDSGLHVKTSRYGPEHFRWHNIQSEWDRARFYHTLPFQVSLIAIILVLLIALMMSTRLYEELPYAPAAPTPYTVIPSASSDWLRITLITYNVEDPRCVTVQQDFPTPITANSTLVIEYLQLEGKFDSTGIARICGLGANQDLQFSIRDSDGHTLGTFFGRAGLIIWVR